MPHPGLTEGAALSLLDTHAVFLLVLLVSALFLLTRWLETADRSAYAIGTLCGVGAAAWLGLVTLDLLANDLFAFLNDIPSAGLVAQALNGIVRLIGLGLLVATLWALLRPLWVTGLFLQAPQAEVRKRWKKVETSWQFGIAFLVAAKAAVLLVDLADRWV